MQVELLGLPGQKMKESVNHNYKCHPQKQYVRMVPKWLRFKNVMPTALYVLGMAKQ